MKPIAELISSSDPRWNEILKRCPHDFYSLPNYCEVEAKRMGGTSAALYLAKEDQVFLLPIIIRQLPNQFSLSLDWLDATSPYGYSGIVTNLLENELQLFLEDLKDLCFETLQKHKLCTIFVRLHPLLNPYSDLPWGCFRRHGDVYWIDLMKSSQELNQMVRSRFRSYIHATIKSGAKVRIDEQFEHYDTFIQLYYNTMEDVGAEDWYFFSKEYFYQLKEALGEVLKLVLVEIEGKIYAAGLYTECNGIVEYHLSGKHKSEDWAHLTKLMMVSMRDWGKARGNRYFHLGGGVGASQNSPLTFFKSGFTKTTSPFCSWRIVTDQEVYQWMIQKWESITQQKADGIEGYFPAYRKGIM
ncbi:MAG: GNAT family N-acetyltransferase [bacterium]|nr:GNAT family N-acetyltransferase [bacterium]